MMAFRIQALKDYPVVAQLFAELSSVRVELSGGGDGPDVEAQVDAATAFRTALEDREKLATKKVFEKKAARRKNKLLGSGRRGVLGFFKEKVNEKVKVWKQEKKQGKEKEDKEKLDRKSCRENPERFEAHILTNELPWKEGKLPECYEEIVKLIEIERRPVYAKALQEWTRKETLFTNRVERKKKKVANLKNEIYQLIGFFSVFQGVLLTAVSQSNLLHCNNQLYPIFLSAIASAVTIAGVFQKLVQIDELQTTIFDDDVSLKDVLDRSSKLRSLGVEGVEKFLFASFEGKDERKQPKSRSRIYFWLVVGSLLVFAVVFPVSHWRILCHPGPNPYVK